MKIEGRKEEEKYRNMNKLMDLRLCLSNSRL